MAAIYGYLRASTDRQDASVPAQRQAVEQFCSQHDHQLVQWFTDDGVSGKSFDRPSYRRMRTRILSGNPDDVDHIIVWSLSRFARVDPDHFIVEKAELAKAGVTLVSASEAITGQRSLASDLVSYVSAHQNREFLVRLSKDVTRGMRALVQNGFWPSLGPLGYSRLVVDGSHNPVVVNGKPLVLQRGQSKGNQNHVILVPGDPDEQAAVRFMFTKRAEGWPFRRIAVALNEMRLKTIYGDSWKFTTVRSCLTNIAYIGHTRYGLRRKYKGIRNQIEGTNRSRNPESELITIENTHEALIPADLFDAVQKTFEKKNKPVIRRRTRGRKLMLFTGAVECTHCGSNYHSQPIKKNGKQYTYYHCSGRLTGKTDERCDALYINADKLKKFIFGEIQRRVTTDEFQIALKSYLVGRIGQILRRDVLDTRDIDKDIRAVEQKKGRLIDSIADGVLRRDDRLVERKLAQLDDELLMLNTRRAEVLRLLGGSLDPDVIAVQLIERVRDLAGFLDSQSVEDQRKALFAFCKRITADAYTREVVIETDLTATAGDNGVIGIPPICSLPDVDSNHKPSG